MPDWFESLVQLRLAGGAKGSGILISSTEVLTAAHVVAVGGVPCALTDLQLDLRFQSRLLRPLAISVSPRWTSTTTSGSDVALVRVDSQSGLGVVPAFGVPAAHGQRMLEGHGFVAQTDAEETLSGNVSHQPPSADDAFLFSGDFAPEPGMSGGPLVTSIGGAVRVVGLLTQRSNNHFIGLAMLASALATLRANF